MSFIPQPHEIYKHFKGNLYQIVAIAEHSETGEDMVVYQALYEDFKIYVRPLEMFTSRVDKDKYPDVQQEYRFERQSLSGSAAIVQTNQQTKPQAVQSREDERSMEQTTQEEHTQEELALDPMVLEFLDADSYEQRLNILAGLQHRITDDMLTTMAIACDVELGDDSTEQRFDSLKNCLLTLEKYECNRLR
ncbi:MAG: DUF1653 domain-containing protein [Lachnospiraceae bacterium]|nr:DUF1653 domain-containing protein [Lachnospiraceae bacterium]